MGSSGGSSTDQAAPEVKGPAIGAPNAATGGTGSGGSDGGTAAAPPHAEVTLAPTDVQRSIVYTGMIALRVKDVPAAAAQAEDIARGVGGYRASSNINMDSGNSSATLVLRVPVASFDSTVASLHDLGTEINRQISSQDVTTQVIDVQSRLKTQQASVDRIRSLMASATSIGQIVSLEDELTSREADLESMEAQLRSLTDLTALSTITVNLYGPEAHVVVAKPKPKATGFLPGLKAGWHGFLAVMTALLTLIGAILPFVVIIGLPVWLITVLIRRRRRTRRPPTGPVLAGDGGGDAGGGEA
jgi:hypothetical protein